MGYESEAAAQYRAKAKELRTAAASYQVEATRQMLIRVAVRLEKTAKLMADLDNRHSGFQHYSSDGDKFW